MTATPGTSRIPSGRYRMRGDDEPGAFTAIADHHRQQPKPKGDAKHDDYVEDEGFVERSLVQYNDQLLQPDGTQQQVHDTQSRPAPDADVMPPEEQPSKTAATRKRVTGSRFITVPIRHNETVTVVEWRLPPSTGQLLRSDRRR